MKMGLGVFAVRQNRLLPRNLRLSFGRLIFLREEVGYYQGLYNKFNKRHEEKDTLRSVESWTVGR